MRSKRNVTKEKQSRSSTILCTMRQGYNTYCPASHWLKKNGKAGLSTNKGASINGHLKRLEQNETESPTIS